MLHHNAPYAQLQGGEGDDDATRFVVPQRF